MELITPRLILRELQQDDYHAMQEMERDPEVIRYEHPLLSEEDFQTVFERALGGQSAQPRVVYRFAVTLPPDDTFRGRVSLMLNNPNIREWEIGWTIQRQEWGKGFATEAAWAVINFGFNELKAHRITAFCHAENAASTRVMEKLGMKYEGRLRKVRWLDERWNDEFVYAILEEDFFNNRAA